MGNTIFVEALVNLQKCARGVFFSRKPKLDTINPNLNKFPFCKVVIYVRHINRGSSALTCEICGKFQCTDKFFTPHNKTSNPCTHENKLKKKKIYGNASVNMATC